VHVYEPCFLTAPSYTGIKLLRSPELKVVTECKFLGREGCAFFIEPLTEPEARGLIMRVGRSRFARKHITLQIHGCAAAAEKLDNLRHLPGGSSYSQVRPSPSRLRPERASSRISPWSCCSLPRRVIRGAYLLQFGSALPVVFSHGGSVFLIPVGL